MKDIKSILLLGVGLVFKLLVGLSAVKLSAELLGPNSFGLTGQINSIMAVVALVSGAGVSLGLGKVFANTQLSESNVNSWYRFSYSLVIGFSSLVAFVVVVSSPWLIESILPGVETPIILGLAIAFAAFPLGIATVYQGKINGLQRGDIFGKSQVVGALLGLIGFLFLVSILRSSGALLGVVWLLVAQALSVIYFSRKINFNLLSEQTLAPSFNESTKKEKLKFLLGFGGLNILSGILMPLTYLLIRHWIEENNSAHFLGLWQASVRISEAYCQLPMTFLTVVLFGRFSSSGGEGVNLSLFLKSVGQMIAILLVILSFVLLAQDMWIPLVFSDKFSAMGPLVGFQVTGDFLRVLSYVFTTYLAAKGKLRYCFFAEMIQAILLITFSYYLIPAYAEFGAHFAYIASYGLYLIVAAIFFYLLGKASPNRATT